MNTYVILGSIAAFFFAGLWFYNKGKKVERGKQNKINAELSDEYAKIANNKPDSRDDLVDKLRGDGL